MRAEWIERVHAALLAADEPRLRQLFDEAVAREGHEVASRSWQAAVSAYDADAVTG